jgi:hypothetical protein
MKTYNYIPKLRFQMIFTAQDLALTAGFKTAAKFTNEMHRYGLPFGTGVRVGNAKRYGTIDLAKAIMMSRLRAFRVPVAQHKDLIDQIDESALASALDQFEAGKVECVIVGIPSWAELDEYSGVFTSRKAALEALTEADFILIDLGEVTQAYLQGVM